MVRKRKVNKLSSRGAIGDPKFQYKCYVLLKNCDFSKYTSIIPDTTQLPLNNSKLCVGNANMNFNQLEMQEKNRTTVQSKIISINTNSNITQQINKTLPEESTENLEMTVDRKKKMLRSRKKVDYREKKSIGTPNLDQIIPFVENNKIPVYNKVEFNSPKCRKRKCDLYDFVVESEDDKDSDVSFKINIPTKKKKICHRVQTHSKKVDCVKRNKTVNYNDKITGIITKFTQKIKFKEGNNIPNQMNELSNNEENDFQIESNNKRVSNSVFNSTMFPESQSKILFSEESFKVNGCNGSNIKMKTMETGKINKTQSVCIPLIGNSSFNVDSPNSPSSNSLYISSSPSSNFSDNPIFESFDGTIDNLFGFMEDIEKDGQKEATNQIHIIQNMVINGSPSPRPYMSTPNRTKESWRFDSYINRNPHFLAIKKNSLPSLNQDPVLDHTFEEHINMVNKIASVHSNKKSSRQMSILNYVEGAKIDTENHNYSQSLYDVDEFSPIKNKKADKENSLQKKKLSKENQSVKRNVLGVINDANTKNITPPFNNVGSCEKIKDINEMNKTSENFGFDIASELEEPEKTVEREARPFRIEFTYQKRAKNKQFLDKITKPVRDSEVRRLIEEDPGFEEVVNQDGLDCGSLGLFEDPEETLKPSSPNVKLHVKKKIAKDNKGKPPQEKLSKEAQKWIKQFNQMCDEVDHEQLEVEY